MTGRIDVHSHLLPNIDDGCASIEESIACAKILVANGYTHSFCTPHIIPGGWGHITRDSIPGWVEALQNELVSAGIPLQLISGGEMNFGADFLQRSNDRIVSYALAGKYALADMWADRLPDHFEPSVQWLQSMGLTVILAHPERMRAIQDDPSLADYLASLGVLLQGNLYCFSDPPHSHTYRLAHQFLREDRYFLLGSDLHKLDTIDARLRGIDEAIKTAGHEVVDRLMIENPQKLIPST